MHIRTPLAVALAALLAAPLGAHAAPAKKPTTTRAQAGAPAQNLSAGGFVGFELGDADGFALRFDGEMPFQKLSPQVALSFVGSLGYSRFSEEVGFIDASTNLFKIIPAARFTLPLNPQLDVYGDAGLGLYYFSSSFEATVPGFGTVDAGDDSGFGFMLRLGAGGFYKVNPQLKIGAELGLSPYFGDVDTTNFTIMGGVMFAL
jgi:opacity protein-like surface antigen